MKLCRLDLLAFGPFTETSIDLTAGEPGLHVIYGDNEDGKSTTLRATRGLLFGIQERTTDDHRHKKSQLRVGGVLRSAAGAELSFVRKKGRKGTLLHPNSGEALAEDALVPFLGDISEPLFSSLYGIDHAELVAGGKAILDQTGDLGKALYAAATGTASLKQVLEELEQEAQGLFRPRASTSRINATLSAYKNKLKEGKDAALPSETWTKLQREQEQVERQLVELDAERMTLRGHLSQRERIRRVRPNLARRQDLLRSLEQLGEVVDLPGDFEQHRRTAADDRRVTTNRLEQVAEEIQRAEDEAARSEVPEALLTQGETIERLFRDLGSYEKALHDRPAQDAKRRQHENEAGELLKAVLPEIEFRAVESIRPLLPLKRTLHDLADRHRDLAREEQSALLALKDAQKRFDELTLQLDQHQQDPSPSRLSAAASSAQRAGDLDTQIDDLSRRLRDRQQQCQLDLDRLGLWDGTLEQLESAPLPSLDTVSVFEARFQRTEDQARATKQQLDGATSRRSELAQRLATLEQRGPVPSTTELEASRKHRNTGWTLVRQHCFGAEKVDPEKIQRFAAHHPLPDAYEETVRAADDVADRLRLDADRVQQRELLGAELQQTDQQLASILAEIQQHEQAAKAPQQEWLQVWAPTRIQPRTPREMAAWVRKAESLRQQLAEARGLQGELDQLAETRLRHRQALLNELKPLDEQLGGLSETERPQLDPIMARALAVLADLTQRATTRQHTEQSAQDALASIAHAEASAKALTKQRDLWKREWQETLAGFDFTTQLSVAKVLATLEQLEELFGRLDKAADFKRRIYGIDKDVTDYNTKVDDFGTSILRPRGQQPVDQYVVQLNETLKTARERDTARKSLDQRRRELDSEGAELRARLRSIDSRFSELRSEAKVEHDDQLVEAAQRASHKHELRSRIAEVEGQLFETGDGHAIEKLTEQSAELAEQELDAEIARLKDELATVEQSRDDLRSQKAALDHDLESTSGGGAAAEAAEQAEQALSELREQVRTYLQVSTASLILQNKIETYRKQNQGPVLRRASELFAQLTLGSYARLQDELDKHNRPVLLGVRPDAQEVPVEGMSEGTRDQLYLSLRLATLEQHLDAGQALPFVVDDILVGFDDRRTEACLRVLADLAARVQVLVFTHHRRVAEIAQSLGEDAGVFVHRLPGRSA